MLNQIIEQLDELGADKLDRVLVVDSNGHALPTVMAYKGDELLTLNKELMGLFLEGLAPYADSVSDIDHNSYYVTRLDLNDASIHNTASSILFTKHCPISIMDTLCMADSLGAKRLLVDFEGADDACESLGWVFKNQDDNPVESLSWTFKNQDDNTAETTNSNERDQIKTAISQLIDELAPGWMEEEGSTGSLGLDLTTGEYKLSRTIYTKKEESELHERELSKVALSGDSIANSKTIAELGFIRTEFAHHLPELENQKNHPTPSL